MRTITELEAERLEWSLKTFPEATWLSSLNKLKSEIKEVEDGYVDFNEREELVEEYADCLMCLFDSAARMFSRNRITPDEIFEVFEIKLEKNKKRAWIKNPDSSYSHIK